MIEAFEIGVTLALSDGVSAGIAQARKDMAQLEHVLQSGGVSVRQLRAASLAALAVGRPAALAGGQEARRERPVSEPVVASEPDASTTQAVQRSEDVSGVAGRAPLAPSPAAERPVEAVQRLAPETPRQVVAPAVAPLAVSMGEPPAESSGQAPVGALDGGNARSAMPFAPAVQNAAYLAAPITLIAPARSESGERQRVGVAESLRGARAASVARDGGQRLVTDFGARLAPGYLPKPAAEVPAGEVLSSRSQALPDTRFVDRPQVPAAAALVSGAPSQTGHGGDAQVQDAQAGQRPSVPPAPPAASGPVHGDVFLDGNLVGRWMSRLLTQEAGRASSGPTGFDPRRGRLLPGATVGG